MTVTADTVTDEQIRELAECGDPAIVTTCYEALGPSDMFWSHAQPTPTEVYAARARCAAILNARAAKP